MGAVYGGDVPAYTGVLIAGDKKRRRRLRRLLAHGGGPLAGPPVEWRELAALSGSELPAAGVSLAIFDCGPYPGAERIGRLIASAPGLGLIVLGDSDETAAAAAALAAGADEYLPWPHLTPAWLRHAIRRTLARRCGRTSALPTEPPSEADDYRRLRAVLDALPVGVYIADAEGRLVEHNAAGEAIWGMDIPKVGPERFALLRARRLESGEPIPPDEWGLARAIQRGESSIAEAIEIDAFDGQTKTLLNYALPIYDAAGRLLGGVAVNVDISALRQAQDEARRARSQLQTTVDRIEDLFWSVDRDWRFTYLNRPLLELWGAAPDVWLGKEMWESWSPLLGTAYETNFRRAVQSQEVVRFEAPSPLSGGYYTVVAYPSKDGLSVFARDISARRQAEEERERLAGALGRSEERLRLALEGGRMGAWSWDLGERMVWTPRMFELVGLPTPAAEQEIAAATALEYVHPDDLPGQRAELLALLEEGEEIRLEFRVRPRQGRERWLALYGRLHRRDDGSPDRLTGVALDVSEGKAVEAALLAANEALEQRVAQRTREITDAIARLRDEVAAGERMVATLAEVRGRLDQAGEAERLLLAQELHDGPLQELTTLGYELAALAVTAPELRERLALMRAVVSETAAGLRRTAQDLRPPLLAHFGLAAALEGYVEQVRAAQPEMAIRMEAAGEAEQAAAALAQPAALALYRICQQALRNAVQHSRASAVTVRFYTERDTLGNPVDNPGSNPGGDTLVLEVEDDGRGFAAPPDLVELARQGHLGMAGMSERAAAVGGVLEVRSQPGAGALVRVRVPPPA